MSIPTVNEHYKVRYKIQGYEKEFETETYSSYELADEHSPEQEGYSD